MRREMNLGIAGVLAVGMLTVVACGGGAAAPTTAPAVPTKAPVAATTAPVATTAPATTVAPAAPTKAPAAAPTIAAAPAPAGDATAGKAVFDQSCNACHPGGDKGVGPALKGRNLSADTIRTTVRSGKGTMPAFSAAQIGDPQLNNLVAYVQSLK